MRVSFGVQALPARVECSLKAELQTALLQSQVQSKSDVNRFHFPAFDSAKSVANPSLIDGTKLIDEREGLFQEAASAG